MIGNKRKMLRECGLRTDGEDVPSNGEEGVLAGSAESGSVDSSLRGRKEKVRCKTSCEVALREGLHGEWWERIIGRELKKKDGQKKDSTFKARERENKQK